MNASRLRSAPAALGLVLIIAAILTALAVLSVTGPRVHAQSDPPERPTGLTATAVGHDSVTLGWNNPNDDEITGYRILRRNVKTQEAGNFSNAGTAAGADAVSFTDSNVGAETKYAYRIVAYSSAGDSPRSGYVNVTTLAEPVSDPPDVPGKPTGLLAASTHDTVLLSWDDPDDDTITGYRILRRDVANQPPGTFSAVASNTGSAATSYTDSGVEAETKYAYRIVGPQRRGSQPPVGLRQRDHARSAARRGDLPGRGAERGPGGNLGQRARRHTPDIGHHRRRHDHPEIRERAQDRQRQPPRAQRVLRHGRRRGGHGIHSCPGPQPGHADHRQRG